MTTTTPNQEIRNPQSAIRNQKRPAALAAKAASHRCAAADGPHPGAHDGPHSNAFAGHENRLANLIHRAASGEPLFDEGKTSNDQ